MELGVRDKTDKALFISRAGVDADFAAEIGSILEGAGYNVTLQQWDFANRNFMEGMHAALVGGARVVALLSPEYLRSDHCQAEWQNAIADDPLNTNSRLILLRVVECEPAGLLRGLAYWDLVPIADNRALVEATVLDAVRQDRRADAPLGPYWRAPRSLVDAEAIRPVPSFSGRMDELKALDATLAVDGGIGAIYGLGGVGKSSVAREYAWRNREKFSVIWWLNAESEDGIVEGVLRLGATLSRGIDQLADRRAAAQQVIGSTLTGFSKPVLLVFDNLEDERLLRRWQPRTNSRIVITSRNAAWSSDVTRIALNNWLPETAIGYLQRESGRTDLSERDARAIAEVLGGLPLALAHAAASLRSMRMVTPQRYLKRLGEYLKNAPDGAEYPRSVFATFSTSIAQAEHQAAGSAAVLCSAALFAGDTIPEELLHQSIERDGEALRPVMPEGANALDLQSAVADDLRLDAALGALDRLSLLAFEPGSRTYSMHRLVQLAAQDIVGDTSAWRAHAISVADAIFPEVDFATWPQCARLVPHVRAVLEDLPVDEGSFAAGRLAYRCAVYLWRRGEYGTAAELQEHALAIREKALAPDHPDVADSLHHLASVYRRQGRYGEAEALFLRALAILEKALGPDHPKVANTLNNFANVYVEQARYNEAEAMYARALVIREKALGPDHPDVASSLTSLANVHYEQGHRPEEEEALHARALAIREKAFGPDHPDVAESLNNLAGACEEQGRYKEAEALYTRGLAIKEKALGPDHPDVARFRSNVANCYREQGRFGEAEPLFVRTLASYEKVLGPHHALVAEALYHLAQLYGNQRRYNEAEPLCMRALALREELFGPDHPDVATSLITLATLYEARGHYDDAEPLYNRALAIREKALGVDHPRTKAVREILEMLARRHLPRGT